MYQSTHVYNIKIAVNIVHPTTCEWFLLINFSTSWILDIHQLSFEDISVTIVLSTSYEVRLACTLTGLGMHNEHDKFISLCKVILIVRVDEPTYSILYYSTYILKLKTSN